MKVLFLDIDGVLNRFGDAHGHGRTKERVDGVIGLDAELLKIYKDMLCHLDVTVVLSSTWRHWPNLRNHLKERGIEYSDVTPTLRDPSLVRGHEISAWLMEHPEVTKYAILDDDTDILPNQVPNYFHVMTEIGITSEVSERVVAHFR